MKAPIVTCPWCHTVYKSFQSKCSNCGALLMRPVDGGDSADMRGAQGAVYKPTGQVATGDGNVQVQIGNVSDSVVNIGAGSRPGEVTELELSPEASHLHRTLVKRLDLEEFRTLCFDLAIDYDSLGGEGFSAKARQLLLYLQKHDNLERVVEWIRRERRDIRL